MISRPLIAAWIFAGSMAGCNHGSRQTPPPATNPAGPVAQSPATEPVTVTLTDSPATAPTTQPGMATLIIGQKGFWFPQAILRLSPAKGKLSARLSTDDPPSAIEENYHGNSFDLNMNLDMPDAADIDGAIWKYSLASTAKADTSAHGIFLDGQRRCLHPQDVNAQFQRQGDKVIVRINGWFLLYETAATDRAFALPKRVWVSGRLEAAVGEK